MSAVTHLSADERQNGARSVSDGPTRHTRMGGEDLEGMRNGGMQVHLDSSSRPEQTERKLQILLPEDIELPAIEVRGRQTRQVTGPQRSGIS